MGKQSARLYYNGEDCYDVYFEGSNLAKMYLNGEMLWERLPPKYILASGNILFTTEVLQALSTFRQYSLNTVYFVGYAGIEYIFNSYYLLIRIRETRTSEPIIWLLNSKNGYDWKKVYDFSNANAKDMKKYMGKLAFVAKKDSDYALCLIDSNLSIEYIFDTSKVIGMDGLNILAVGNGTILLIDDNRTYIAVIRDGKYIGVISEASFPHEEGESVTFQSRASYDKNDGFFYMDVFINRNPGSGHCIYRSKDGISWIKYLNTNYAVGSGMIFDNDYIYYEGTAMNSSRRLVRIKKNNAVSELYEFPGAGICYIDDFFYFCYRDKIYKSKDLFNVTQYYDSITGYYLEGAEEVRTSDKHQWSMPSIGTPVFNCICCTDENVRIYI